MSAKRLAKANTISNSAPSTKIARLERQLEIEAALEKVRIRANSMRQSDQLKEVIQEVFDQLQGLGLKPHMCCIDIINTKSKDLNLWVATPNADYPSEVVIPHFDNPIFTEYYAARKKRRVLHTANFSKEVKDAFFEHTFKNTGLKAASRKRKEFVFNGSSYTLSSAMTRNLSIWMVNYQGQVFSKEHNQILLKFTRVFDQCYTRFLDIKKAEEQAREAQIEAALERVRALALAMQSSNEILQVAQVIFKELTSLEFKLARIVLWTFDNEDKSVTWWSANPEETVDSYLIPYQDHPVYKTYWREYQNRTPKFHYKLTGKNKKSWDQVLFNQTELVKMPKKVKMGMQSPKTVYLANTYYDFGVLFTGTLEPISDAKFDILVRFGKVFNQTYTRFLDLKKAEEQARESVIELALERVRARTMAMHKGEELADTALLLFEQITELGIQPRGCGFLIMDKETKSMQDWSANINEKGKASLVTGTLSFDQHPILSEVVDTWKTGKPYFIGEVHGKELQKYYKAVTSKESTSKSIQDNVLSKYQSEWTNSFYFEYGMMYALTPYAISEEEINILLRFARVFKLTYRRFLDLKKAEEQAREAQIEAALERVRSRTMGMQKSEELTEVAMLLNYEFRKLDYPELFEVGYIRWDEQANQQKGWLSDFQGKGMEPFSLPLKGDWVLNERYNAWKSQKSLLYQEIGGARLLDHVSFCMPSIKADKVKQQVKQHFSDPTHFYHSFFEEGALCVITQQPLSNEQQNLHQRFTRVFKQTYTRFLDLKKAEEQAREAQIEVALERVRASTMAMQTSDKMPEVGALLYKELFKLGITSMTGGITLIDDDGRIDWYYMVEPDGTMKQEPMGIPRDETKVMRSLTASWEKQEPYQLVALNKKETITHQTYIAENSINFSFSAKELISLSPERLALQTFNFKQGYLLLVGGEKLSQDQVDITVRFSKVFEQTYTRFLDLKNAEEQAREAQIEASLERIRAKAMAMHNSKDIGKTTAVMFNELKSLGVETLRTGISIIDVEKKTMELWMSNASDHYDIVGKIPLRANKIFTSYLASWQKGKKVWSYLLSGDEVKLYYASLAKYSYIPKRKKGVNKQECMNAFMFSDGGVNAVTLEPLTEEANLILLRFAGVFDMTYRRYLDLKKAEAQAREAQIEASLERVRAKAMAMHSSEDLVQTVGQLFKELNSLEISLLRCGVGRVHKETRELELYTFSGATKGDPVPVIGKAILKGHPVLNGCFKHWEKQEEYHPVLKGALLKKYYESIKANYKLPGKQESLIQYGYFFPFSAGVLFTYTETKFNKEELSIFRKFSSVVGLTYRRFLDLTEAEAQAREAQIEVALERIRARALAMHNSDELMEVANVMREQMNLLGQPQLQTAAIHLYPEEGDVFDSWLSLHPKGKRDDTITETVTFSKDQTQLAREMLAHYRSGKKEYTMHVRGKPFKEWRQMAQENNPSLLKYWGNDVPDQIYWHFTDFSGGSFVMVSREPPTDESKALQSRVSATFDLAYRRFQDLKQAESQAHEAKIETALERVRAAAMAMHSSDDLFSVASVLHNQLAALGQKELESSIIHIYPEDSTTFDAWYSYRPTDNESRQVMDRALIRNDACSWTRAVLAHYKSNQSSYLIESRGKMLRDWYRVLATEVAPAVIDYDENGNIIVPKVLYYHFSKFSGGALLMISNEPPAKETCDLLLRAASVFDLAYRRFLDLQKAENQAREAQIEAGLERVRASTMAMHSSEDVGTATMVLFQELENLGIETLRCGISIIKENRTMEVWAASTSSGGEVFTVPGIVDMTFHPMVNQLFDYWKSGKKVFAYELKGKDAKQYYQSLENMPDYVVPMGKSLPDRHISNGFLFRQGALFAFTRDFLSKEAIEICQKFTNVFTLTYGRYLDLKQAEAREKEAVKQSSLDRVRAEIASMRNKEDLQRITPLVWRELGSLGVPFFRCGVFIIDEAAETVHMYLSTPDGNPLAALHLGFDEQEIPLVEDAIAHWKTQTVHITHWDQQQFKTFTQSLKNRGLIKSLKTYQHGEKPPNSLNLHQVPFKQGMLYVGSSELLTDEQIELVQALAEAFSVAYSRYEDFVQLEEAKANVENTLAELKSAQDQLVHSEKMASLGELTAGIAHEIQNPLNFVNNFSEVSGELLSELQEEMESGNYEEVEELIEDLIQNLDKITHHGTRASSIVRGMLDHSRASSDEKVSTDINLLADEYLRLAYHGFRAKDKSFNANFTTELAEGLPKIDVVSQDIGRVILNLVNNAFQAVREVENPEVIVKTQMKDRSVVISVKDNGPGIPENIKEKIFQPFFTTKATGEGTGLGLSLSYDIVTKGHGGEIVVNSNVGKGTEFVIHLPS